MLGSLPINIGLVTALNLAMLNDYRTCTCTSMHRHTALVVFIPVLLYTR